MNDTYLPKTKLKYYSGTSSYFTIILIIMYIIIIYKECMQFPRPMPEHKFDNQYNVIIFALSTILDQLERINQSFAAQCVWWLASIIQYTEILLFY